MDAAENGQPTEPLDDPDRLQWSADAQDGCISQKSDALDGVTSGQFIRFMWDLQVPLWSRTGHMSEDPVWLSQVLGVSDDLVTDMMAWCDDMDRLNDKRLLRTEQTLADMSRRGRALAERLQAEVGTNYIVEFKC